MNEQIMWQLFQIKPGRYEDVYVDPQDPKGIKAIQAILQRMDAEAEALKEE